MLVAEIPISQEDYRKPKEEYVEIDLTGLKRSSTDLRYPGNIEDLSFTKMIMPCGGDVCNVEQYKDQITEKTLR